MTKRFLMRSNGQVGGGGAVPRGPGTGAAHERGDVPTNNRGVQVRDLGRGQGDELRRQPPVQQERRGPERLRHRVRAARRAGVRAGRHAPRGHADHQHHRPADPRRVAVYDCEITQGDIQVWKQRRPGAGQLHRRRHRRRGRRGLPVRPRPRPRRRRRRHGDRRPHHARAARDGELPAGAARLAQHDDPPERRLPLQLQLRPHHEHRARRSRSTTSATRRSPKKVQDFPIPFVPTSLGSESHDITFNSSGTRAYSAALSQTLVLDTTNPRSPEADQPDRRPVDQRGAPGRPGDADAAERHEAEGARHHRRARRRGRERRVPGRRSAPLRHHRREGAEPGEDRHLVHPDTSSRRTAPPAPPTCCGSTRARS